MGAAEALPCSAERHLGGSPGANRQSWALCRAACAPGLTLPFLSPLPAFLPSPLRPPASVCACLSTCLSVRLYLSLVSLLLLLLLLSGTSPSHPVTRGTSSSRALFVVDLFQLLDLRPNSMLLLNKLLFGSWLFGLVFPPPFLFFFFNFFPFFCLFFKKLSDFPPLSPPPPPP